MTDSRRTGLPVGDLPLLGPITWEITSALPTPDRVLAVGAHPDDIEFGAGATLARWASEGSEVHWAIATDGSKGTWDPDASLDALVDARRAECLAAAATVIGHSADDRVHFLDQVDGELVKDEATRRLLVALLRSVRPSIVLGHDPWRRYRLHPDHRTVGFLTLDAVVASRDPHFFPDIGSTPHRPQGILLWEADQPNHVEDARGWETHKEAALLCHLSQQETTMGIDDASDAQSLFARRLRHQLATHGELIGISAGEAFHFIDQV